MFYLFQKIKKTSFYRLKKFIFIYIYLINIDRSVNVCEKLKFYKIAV